MSDRVLSTYIDRDTEPLREDAKCDRCGHREYDYHTHGERLCSECLTEQRDEIEPLIALKNALPDSIANDCEIEDTALYTPCGLTVTAYKNSYHYTENDGEAKTKAALTELVEFIKRRNRE